MTNPLWQEIPLTEGEIHFVRVGELNLWFRGTKGEFQYAFTHENAEKSEGSSHETVPENLVWNRWTTGATISKVALKPQMPERPVVIKPESNIHLRAGSRCTLFARIPLWLCAQLAVGRRKEAQMVLDIPTVVLSKTWFGSFVEGQLCYWLSSSARTEAVPDPSRPYLALAAITVENKSDEELHAEKLLVDVRKLPLFEQDGQIWTAEYQMTFRGEAKVSQVVVAKKPPAVAETAKMIAEPRETAKSLFSLVSFGLIQELTGLGIQM